MKHTSRYSFPHAAVLTALIILISFLVPASLWAETPTPKQVYDHVNKAVDLVASLGPDQAFPILSEPDGEYNKGDLYVFTYDMNGTIIQHARPRLVGKNMMKIKDKNGKCLACDFVRIAKTEGEGWSEYYWPQPSTGKIEVKVSYIKKIPGYEMFCGVGVYGISKKDAEEAMKQ